MEFTRKKLTRCVSRHLDIPEAEFKRIPTGRFNTSFYVRARERDYVLRIAPPDDGVFLFYEKNMMRQEPGLHSLLLEKTDAPIPGIIAFDWSRSVIEADYLIMERLPGIPLSDSPAACAGEILRQTGAALSKVHAVTADQYGYLGEHAPMKPRDSWKEAFAVMWESLIGDVEGTGHYTAADCRFMAGLFDRYADVFERDVPASLLHMDIWAENLLVSGGDLSGILDWDRALWGDREIEYAVLDYCGISEPEFWEGYGRKRDRSGDARLRGLFYYLYELQKYIVIRHGRQNNPVLARSCRDAAPASARELAS